jgi:integrative and conjugative element protein (TIGR02256 family)
MAGMAAFIQNKPTKPEAGGVLLGRYISGTEDVVVDRVTTPMPGDRRTRFSFFRKAKRHQSVVDLAWIGSNHSCNYLGGWHTHPEASPEPSRVDLRDWKRALRIETFDSESLFFAILGLVDLRVWEGARESSFISEMERIETD